MLKKDQARVIIKHFYLAQGQTKRRMPCQHSILKAPDFRAVYNRVRVPLGSKDHASPYSVHWDARTLS